MRLTSCVDWLGILLGEASGNESSQHISDNNSTDPAVGFGEGDHSSETYGSSDFGWDTGLGKVAGNSDEVGGGGVVIEQDAEGIGGEPRRAWRRSFASSSQVQSDEVIR